ncbi:hypothetical protein RS130_13465 [Paraglaciecola aquimarina]|uniref:EF-hand domain-containing protein n=1 Tax=Paraglaciecola aquimarina TaxID=1235557 RepID=A0ABU3SXP7_9ALTE|nr:hypothetical protein [Paraglaciecola aquimarina]MDU0354793.1 hypothetical protein [Paraglaciecola aquimarina]
MTTSSIAITAILTAFTSFSSLAGDDEALIDKFDLDQDGQISIKEAVAEPQLLAAFGKIDTDGNGVITKQELSKSGFRLIRF